MRALLQMLGGLAIGGAVLALFWFGTAPPEVQTHQPQRSSEPAAIPPAMRDSFRASDGNGLTDDAKKAGAKADGPPDDALVTRLLHAPVADTAGEITAGGYDITLAGIVPTDPQLTCPDAGGGTWPCGAAARTAFRAWLRGRAIRCDVPRTSAPGRLVTECTVGRDDVGEWLVRHGWAGVPAGSAYEALAEEAKRSRAGMFGPRAR